MNQHLVNGIMRQLELHLSDLAEEEGDIAEQAYTMAVDAATDYGLEGEEAVSTAREAVSQMGLSEVEFIAPGYQMQYYCGSAKEVYLSSPKAFVIKDFPKEEWIEVRCVICNIDEDGCYMRVTNRIGDVNPEPMSPIRKLSDILKEMNLGQ